METTMVQALTGVSVSIIVASDRAKQGVYEDLSGPAARRWLQDHGAEVRTLEVVSDDQESIAAACRGVLDSSQLIVISGGTGLGPRDVTPQTLDNFCDYTIPGIGELLRRESLKYSLNAYLSRCGGWVKDRTLLLALPGNHKAVFEQLEILTDLLPHALESVQGKCKHRRRVESEE